MCNKSASIFASRQIPLKSSAYINTMVRQICEVGELKPNITKKRTLRCWCCSLMGILSASNFKLKYTYQHHRIKCPAQLKS